MVDANQIYKIQCPYIDNILPCYITSGFSRNEHNNWALSRQLLISCTGSSALIDAMFSETAKVVTILTVYLYLCFQSLPAL